MDADGGRPVPLPDDGLPVIERSVVRLVVLDIMRQAAAVPHPRPRPARFGDVVGTAGRRHRARRNLP